MPPVRDASTKPSAATVLPAPVACSNQKRLAALGSSTSSDDLLVGVRPVDRDPRRRPRPRAAPPGSSSSPGRPAGASSSGSSETAPLELPVAVALRLGQQRGQRAGQRVDLVGRQHGAVDQRRLVLGEQAVEAQQQRPAAAPAGGGHLVALVELGQHGVERAPARRARGERGRGVLPFEQEGFTGERSRPLEIVGRWKGCDRQGRCLRLSHEGSTNRRREKSCGPPHDFEQARDRSGDGVVYETPAREAPHIQADSATASADLPPYVPMRRYAAILAALALIAVLVVGLRQAGGDSTARSASSTSPRPSAS